MHHLAEFLAPSQFFQTPPVLGTLRRGNLLAHGSQIEHFDVGRFDVERFGFQRLSVERLLLARANLFAFCVLSVHLDFLQPYR